jgi:hypothetical protein
MKARLFVVVVWMLLINSVTALPPSYPIVVESSTPTIFNNIVSRAKEENVAKKDIGDIVVWSSLQLLNSPYVGGLLDKTTPEYLYISLSDTDCMLFVEQVAVLSRLIKANKLTFDNYVDGIKQIRYHGELSYCNRNHYFKDWVVMNQDKGYVKDIALTLSGNQLPYKASILSQVISNNPSNIHYNDLSCIKEREHLVNKQTIGFIATKDIPKYQDKIKSGDIIGVVTNNLTHADSIQHLGIAYINDGKLSYINASSKKANMKVVVYDSIIDYIKEHNFVGIIVVRVLP